MSDIERKAQDFADAYTQGDATMIRILLKRAAYDGYVAGATKQKVLDREDFKSLVKREFDSLYNLYIRKAGCDSEYSRTVAPAQMDAIDTLKNAILEAMED